MPSSSSYPHEYTQFIYDFIINMVYTKVIKSIHARKLDTPSEFMDTFIESAKTKALWNPIFIELHYPIKYYIEISNISASKINREHNIFVYSNPSTFQEYVDSMVNIDNTCSSDYIKFMRNMKDNVFHANLKTKWESDNTKYPLYNQIISNVMTHVFISCNRADLLDNTKYYDNNMPLFLNIIPFYEYMHTRNTGKSNANLEKTENMEEIEFDIIEKHTMNLVYAYIK